MPLLRCRSALLVSRLLLQPALLGCCRLQLAPLRLALPALRTLLLHPVWLGCRSLLQPALLRCLLQPALFGCRGRGLQPVALCLLCQSATLACCFFLQPALLGCLSCQLHSAALFLRCRCQSALLVCHLLLQPVLLGCGFLLKALFGCLPQPALPGCLLLQLHSAARVLRCHCQSALLVSHLESLLLVPSPERFAAPEYCATGLELTHESSGHHCHAHPLAQLKLLKLHGPARIRHHEAWFDEQLRRSEAQGLAPDPVARLEHDGDPTERMHGGDLTVEPSVLSTAEDPSSIAHLDRHILADTTDIRCDSHGADRPARGQAPVPLILQLILLRLRLHLYGACQVASNLRCLSPL
mmetsp:Transcript_62106/g.202695  ORF Transcript_62106/g.202695 Transcript_62106/m.202695 type:complete len:354 (+) Transcript_62106:768-1829(+)